MRSVGPGAGPEEAGADDVPYHFLKGQAVLFVHRHEERREHDPQHEEHSPGAPHRPTGQQIGGDPHQPAASETNELPLGEVERQLGLDPGKVIGNIHIGYGRSLLSVPRHFWTRCPEAGVHSTSFPHTSQPGEVCQANSSTRGTSPRRATIFSQASPGFLLWASMGDGLMDIGGLPPGTAPRRQQAHLRVGLGPEAQAVKPAIRLAVLFQPDKGHALILKAQRLHETQGLRELGERGPQEQGAVRGGQFRHGEGAQVVDSHSGVVPLCRPLQILLGVPPGRVRVDHSVFPDKIPPFRSALDTMSRSSDF